MAVKVQNWLRAFLLVSATTPVLSVLSCGGGTEAVETPPDEPKPLTAEEQWDQKVKVTMKMINDNFDKYYGTFENPRQWTYNPGTGVFLRGTVFDNGRTVPRDFELDPDTIAIGGWAFSFAEFFPGFKFKLPAKTYGIGSNAFEYVVLPKPFIFNNPMSIGQHAFYNATLYKGFFLPVKIKDDYKYNIEYNSFYDAILPEGCIWYNEFKEPVPNNPQPSWGWSVHQTDWNKLSNDLDDIYLENPNTS